MSLQKPTTPESFTASSQALNQIVEQFRSQTLPLEEALTLFETGIAHVRNCQQTLGTAKGKLQTINQALAEIQAPQASLSPIHLETIPEEPIPTTTQPATALMANHFIWQTHHTLPISPPESMLVLDEAWLKQLLLKIKAGLPFPTQGLPKLYERENRSGLEAFLPLANGWLTISVWRPTNNQQGLIHLQLHLAESETSCLQQFTPSIIEDVLATAIVLP